jgi:hypothetical protein
MSFSNYAAQALLNSFFGKTSNFGALASAPTLYVALFNTKPGEDGTGGTEVSGGGYAREQTASSDWNSATNADPSEVTNANAIDFGTTTGSWGTVTSVGLYDAATGGNMLLAADLTSSKSVASGDAVEFPAGELKIRAD